MLVARAITSECFETRNNRMPLHDVSICLGCLRTVAFESLVPFRIALGYNECFWFCEVFTCNRFILNLQKLHNLKFLLKFTTKCALPRIRMVKVEGQGTLRWGFIRPICHQQQFKVRVQGRNSWGEERWECTNICSNDFPNQCSTTLFCVAAPVRTNRNIKRGPGFIQPSNITLS